MKVYLLSTGSYSDERTHSIWSDKAKAEEVNSILDDNNGVQEWELDTVPEEDEINWKFTFSQSGELTDTKLKSYGWDEIEEEDDSLAVSLCIKGFDREKAFKIATDRRAEYLAKKHGI